MIALLYPRIAANGIRKNKRLYIPFFIVSILMISVFYIIHFLGASDTMSEMTGSRTIANIMAIGSLILGVFGSIVLFYIHSTLFKGRTKEFGLYSMLGMNKMNIARIVFFENLYAWFISITGGLITGIAFSKLAELGFARIIDTPVNYAFNVSKVSVIFTIIGFSFIFGLIYINTVRKIGFSRPVELVRAEKAAEKPPRANWLAGLFGLLTLGTGYAISLFIEEPLAVLSWFLLASVLVIIGTFITLISGSVLLCKILQKNINYYYKTNHFISVSSMTYRMRRNGAGLAAICILLTMTLVTLSTTATMYSSIDFYVDTRFPCDINASANKYGYDPNLNSMGNALTDRIVENAKAEGADIGDLGSYTCYSVKGNYVNGEFKSVSFYNTDIDNGVQYVFMDINDYNNSFNCHEQLGNGEAIVASGDKNDRTDVIKLGDLSLNVVKRIDDKLDALDPFAFFAAPDTLVYVIVNNNDEIAKEHLSKYESDGNKSMIRCIWKASFNTGMNDEDQIRLSNEISEFLDGSREDNDLMLTNCYNPIQMRHELIDSLGGLMFLGTLLSIIFLISSFVIIYYKQISEGYEDQSRFSIMQKVGMTKKEIRKSIESQMLTVFLIPIAFACIHLIVVMPLISKILMLSGLYNPMRLQITAGICALICGLIYTLVYKATSNSYFKIVSA